LTLKHLARLHAADLDVVEGDVEDAGRLDQPVVGHHGHLLARGLGDGGQDRVLVHRQHDERLGTLGHQALDVAQLLFGRAARVGADVLGAELF
jgi:hypothetical protein